MKLVLKLVILGIVILFVYNYSESHDIRIREKYFMKNNFPEGANFTGRSANNERINRPGGPPDRPMRNNNNPAFTAEFRKNMELERTANVSWIKEATMTYSPDSWYMLMKYESLPESAETTADDGSIVTSGKPTDTFHYLRGRTKIDFLSSMEKDIHESAHGYFDQNVYQYLLENNLKMISGDACGSIYISPEKHFYISFPFKALFPSHELAAVIPEDLRTYRFGTYIEGSTSTQSDGVIGLLNELHAYYLGSKYCFDMLEPYKSAAGSDAAGLFEWVNHSQSSMSAFYEFDFFIREYLLLMKKKNAADYAMLKSDRSFTEAYLTLRQLYKELIDNYQSRIGYEMKRLNSSGEQIAKINNEWLWVKSGRSNVSSGTPIFSDERKILMPVLDSRRYRNIAEDFPDLPLLFKTP
jgi:hypothetical protein